MGWGEALSGIIDIAGGLIGDDEDDLAEQDHDWQVEFAKNGIQWKAKDAVKAGLHPLAALGAQTLSYAPSRVGGSRLQEGLSRGGQSLGRAIDSNLTAEDKELIRIRLEQEKAKTEGLLLANDLTKRRIDQLDNPSLPNAGKSAVTKAFGVDGQDDAAMKGVKVVPSVITHSTKRGMESGQRPAIKTFKDTRGRQYRTPADSEAFSFDENPVAATRYYINQGLDYAQVLKNPGWPSNMRIVINKMQPARKGYHWKYNPMTGEFREFSNRQNPERLYFWPKKYLNAVKKFGGKPIWGNRTAQPKMRPSHGPGRYYGQ